MALIDFGSIIKGATKGLLTTVEQGVIKLYDSNIAPIGKQWLKDESAKLIDNNYDKVFKGIHVKVRGWIDKIDGIEGNLPPMPGEVTPAGPMSTEEYNALMAKRGLAPQPEAPAAPAPTEAPQA